LSAILPAVPPRKNHHPSKAWQKRASNIYYRKYCIYDYYEYYRLMYTAFGASSSSSFALSGHRSAFLELVMRLLTFLGVAAGCITAQAGDDRFGFATHFDQGWPSSPTMQAIASTGVSYIRDDLYAPNWETSRGVYLQPVWAMGWLNAAKANGLKVVAVLGPNKNYPDNYDPVAMSNLAVWIARTGLVTAFEITNEPNNAYRIYEGATWLTKLSALTNAVSAAVHAVSPTIQVIGLGAQGSQIFSMLATGTTMDGVVYHPYANWSDLPESTYEWQYLDYESWIQALASKTAMPKWETEWGIGTSAPLTNAGQATFVARRLLQEAGLGVEHTFIYEFKDNGTELYGVESGNTPKLAFPVVQRIIATLAGVQGGISSVTVNSVANGDLGDVKAYAYQGTNKTVVSLWFGNHRISSPPPPSTCNLTFTVPFAYSQPYVLNAMTGTQVPLSIYGCTSNGNQLTVTGLPISDQPLIIVMQ
jgi:hypothetical protein